MRVYAVDKPDLAPLVMPARFKHDIAYFMTPGGERGAPKLPPGEFWINLTDAQSWLDDGVLLVYSPLDSEKQAELEITQEQEDWLGWLIANQVQHVRLEP
jgi:hypothetical protein